MYSKKFLNNSDFFIRDVPGVNMINDNTQFLIDLIKEFNIKNIDFLACNSLQYANWNKYYDLLKTNTSVVVGASDDETGNIKYGGDWLLENTLEDVKTIYFNENIENYTSTLATTVQINGGLPADNNIYIKQLTNGNIYYSTTNNADDNISTGTWTQINTAVDWQVNVSNTNSTKNETNRLTVIFLSDMILNNINNSFIIENFTKFITINGNNKTFYINNIQGWTGLVNGGYGTGDLIIQNINMRITGTSNLAGVAGYIMKEYSCSAANGTNIVENCVNYCDFSGPGDSGGGIIGFRYALDTAVESINIIRNCKNYGNNISFYAGGICGVYCFTNNSTNIIENCINSGSLTNELSSGIVGAFSFNIMNDNSSKSNIINCINTGNQLANNCSGIIYSAGPCKITNCFSIGNITNLAGSAGIINMRMNPQQGVTQTFIITNCYTLYGNITIEPLVMTINNCYEPLGTWDTTTAKTSLLVDSTNVWGYDKLNGATNIALPFVLLSFNPTYDSVFFGVPIITIPCFKEDTLILTNTGYVPIQNLRKGDLIKTLLHDFVPLNMIGSRVIYNSSDVDIKDRLYVCSKSEYSDITEDLIITGTHSILVDELKENEIDKTRLVLGNIFITDNKYRLPACVDNRAKYYDNEGSFTIYHIALDNNDYYMNYGVYANGLLVETCSKRYLKELSGMSLIE